MPNMAPKVAYRAHNGSRMPPNVAPWGPNGFTINPKVDQGDHTGSQEPSKMESKVPQGDPKSTEGTPSRTKQEKLTN